VQEFQFREKEITDLWALHTLTSTVKLPVLTI